MKFTPTISRDVCKLMLSVKTKIMKFLVTKYLKNECDLRKILTPQRLNMLDLSFEFSNYSKEKIELKKHYADAPQGRRNKGNMGRLPHPPNFQQKLAKSVPLKFIYSEKGTTFHLYLLTKKNGYIPIYIFLIFVDSLEYINYYYYFCYCPKHFFRLIEGQQSAGVGVKIS